jgi:hypothetical protein
MLESDNTARDGQEMTWRSSRRRCAPVPEVLVEQFRKESGLVTLGSAGKVRAEFYAIFTERKLKHPAVLGILDKAVSLFEVSALLRQRCRRADLPRVRSG